MSDRRKASAKDPKARAREQLDPEVRARIEAAALDLFAERPFHKVNLPEIASHGRASLQTIYKYYGSKEALLFATLSSHFDDLAARLADHLRAIETFKDRLRKVFWVVLDYVERNPKVALLIGGSAWREWIVDDTFRQPDLSSTLLRVLAEGREQGVLTDEVSETVLLDFFMGILFRQVQMYVARGMKVPPTRNANAVFDMLWRAIARP